MIKLTEILKEKPKAIFLAGPAGSGKSTFVKQYLANKPLKVINIDDSYEELLKKAGLDKPQSGFTADELSQASKLMGQAQKATREKFEDAMRNAESVIIDGTGAASNPIRKKKQALEDLGYETFMVMIYVSPLTSLERNASRDRQLRPSIITRTWNNVINNISAYREMFGNNIVVVDNDVEGADKTYSEKEVEKYFAQVSYKGKEKTAAEKEKSDREKAELVASIKNLLANPPQFDSPQQIQSKINGFLN